MFRGVIVERGDAEAVFSSPLHPYTRALLEAARFVPPEERDIGDAAAEAGEAETPEGSCRFSERCPLAAEVCRAAEPALAEVACGHAVACYLHYPPRGA